MAVFKPNLQRRKDLEAALARCKPREKWGLPALALVWGVTKQRFVTIRNDIAAFPQPEKGEGNEYVYSGRKALKAMLAYEKRHDSAAMAKRARTDAIMGKARATDDAAAFHSPSELATLSRLAAEVEEREREMGLYVPKAEVAQILGDVFSTISDLLSRLANSVDPHGLLPVPVRAQIDRGGQDVLLQCHKDLRDMLSPDARPAANRGKTGRAGGARTRR